MHQGYVRWHDFHATFMKIAPAAQNTLRIINFLLNPFHP